MDIENIKKIAKQINLVINSDKMTHDIRNPTYSKFYL